MVDRIVVKWKTLFNNESYLQSLLLTITLKRIILNPIYPCGEKSLTLKFPKDYFIIQIIGNTLFLQNYHILPNCSNHNMSVNIIMLLSKWFVFKSSILYFISRSFYIFYAFMSVNKILANLQVSCSLQIHV